MVKQRKIPLLYKGLFTAYMLLYVICYLKRYGIQNFLWVSSVILILVYLATLFESRFVASMAAVGGLVTESLWVVDFFFTLIAWGVGSRYMGFTRYMFDPHLALELRIIALFHIALPPLLLWLVFRLGYASRAWLVQIGLTWAILLASWLFTNPALNINLVYSYQKFEALQMSAPLYLILFFSLAIPIIGGTHLFLKALTKKYLT